MREFGSEHSLMALPDGYFKSLEEFAKECTYLRSGREALLYVSLNCKPKGKIPIILFPAYCCWSMSAPFEKLGWQVIYYRLNENLSVNLNYLKELLKEMKPDAILTMNFYGIASTDKTIAIVKKIYPKCVAIEDFSHCTFSIKGIFNKEVDYYVSSIRKSIGICDGAVVLSRSKMDKNFINPADSYFCNVRYEAQLEKSRYTFTKNQENKKAFINNFYKGEDILNHFDKVHAISKIGKKMLKAVNGEEISFTRRENFGHLMKKLSGKVNLIQGVEKASQGVPFSMPVLVEDRDGVQKKLAQGGVYASVLWPIADEARRICPVSAYVADHMLSIPVDQRYDYDDIEEIGNLVILLADEKTSCFGSECTPSACN